jgi:methionyl-tRNA synthetase
MKKVKQKCDKCGHALKYEDICDNCGKTIDYQNEIFHHYLTITRTNPEGKDEWKFQFCGIECMTQWMQKRELEKEYAPTSPYKWQDDIRKKFNIPL